MANIPDFSDPYFAALYRWFNQNVPAWEQCHNPSFIWPVQDAIKNLVPDTGAHEIVIGKQRITDPLYMSTVPPGAVLSEAAFIVKQALMQIIHGGNPRNPDYRFMAGNKELRPMAMPMRTDELLYPEQLADHGQGHCWCICMSSRTELTRRMYTDDHPRLGPVHFRIPGASGNKYYAYHLMAFAVAYINEITPGHFAGLDAPTPCLADLQTITKGKRNDSNVLRHVCGNKFCINPFHGSVGTKAENDLEEHCHHFLRMMPTMHQYTAFRENVCELFHARRDVGEPACWTNNYDVEGLNAKRLSMSQVPPEEQEAVVLQDPGVV